MVGRNAEISNGGTVESSNNRMMLWSNRRVVELSTSRMVVSSNRRIVERYLSYYGRSKRRIVECWFRFLQNDRPQYSQSWPNSHRPRNAFSSTDSALMYTLKDMAEENDSSHIQLVQLHRRGIQRRQNDRNLLRLEANSFRSAINSARWSSLFRKSRATVYSWGAETFFALSLCRHLFCRKVIEG